VGPKERFITPRIAHPKPLLLVDIDGVVSLFGFPGAAGPHASALDARPAEAPADGAIEGSFHTIDGIPHFLSSTAAGHLLALVESFELVWASGWEEKANEHLPRLLGLPAGLPHIPFSESSGQLARPPHAHWKLEAIASYVGERPLAWVDDAFNPACHEWASARAAPTLLVSTTPEQGLTEREAQALLAWAGELQARG
jgi:HAD domain in Swiss Army Knife RNA repair proteins